MIFNKKKMFLFSISYMHFVNNRTKIAKHKEKRRARHKSVIFLRVLKDNN